MPAIKWGDLVNNTDEPITLESGESIECQMVWIGDEVRIHAQHGGE